MLEVLVARKTLEAEGVAGFELVSAEGGELPAFSAGAHLDVHLPGGLVRQYSLCNPPGERHRYRIAVQREPQSRGGSAAMHALAEGDRLRISEPRNHFPLAAGEAPALLVAGGIGITPLLCMAQALAARNAPFSLHCCSRTRARLAFADLLCAPPLAAHTRLHLDDGPGDQRFDPQAVLAACSPDTHLYVCGPAGFMDQVLDTARRGGWSEARLHREYFSAPATSAPSATADGSFELLLQRSGRVVRVAADRTALQALQDAGVDVPSSCEQGICGTCLTPVLDGEPDHRDLYLTDGEHARNDCFTPCCSRARSARLVIDL
jgi:vanillate O-demethylase ferredoxin subunit